MRIDSEGPPRARPRARGPAFRLRGREVMRIEALSDAVFGFAITLLVVSLEVPQSFAELWRAMLGFPAFAASFALLAMVWVNQHRFFRRYGLQDGTTVVLNLVLLFVVLFFVYPLKYVFGFVVGGVLRSMGVDVAPAGFEGPRVIEGIANGSLMMAVFGIGYACVFALFAAMHAHAWRLRDALALSPLEAYDTLDNVRESALNVAIAAVSIGFALAGSPWAAGMVYWAIGPTMAAHGFWSAARRKRLLAGAGPPPGVAAA